MAFNLLARLVFIVIVHFTVVRLQLVFFKLSIKGPPFDRMTGGKVTRRPCDRLEGNHATFTHARTQSKPLRESKQAEPREQSKQGDQAKQA